MPYNPRDDMLPPSDHEDDDQWAASQAVRQENAALQEGIHVATSRTAQSLSAETLKLRHEHASKLNETREHRQRTISNQNPQLPRPR